ncbi:alpha-amylase family glycosyl hydrolase [Methylobacillus flagellatus]|uniref:Alpha amylase, catalytic region n=1 Tax=Methylobacillus flagellatus (strain ATCC 51484 / DSM 6875 / VKM B-1610 / KT) TaxID=265072 RepID=Q1GY12_METFK|nr:alpha-amylase family glycosyl hydrolase [Methylobacillus flagellatus]ABE50875.1 alpha amylase, catalytic region [Methylobacillus flagellatus KT]
MYEQVSHSLLNDILIGLDPKVGCEDLKHFYIRLGANFYAIHSLFHQLYGDRQDFRLQMHKLVAVMAKQYVSRPQELRHRDLAREKDHNWFLSQKLAGYALYCQEFAQSLKGMHEKLDYLQELGINLIHIMPILDGPKGRNDGGYAVRDFRKIDEKYGTLEDLDTLSAELRSRDMLLVLDVVVNHTSDEHEWALKAQQGNKKYQEYYYTYPDRKIPDLFEQTMPEVFPDTAPGNFTWNEKMGRWVMTVFNNFQWDLNYRNPSVFIEMIDIILFWANHGADVIRLDAVAFLWKKIGSPCQNEREAHLILQLMKDCCQVTAPGTLFIAEAIVAPLEIIKYFGEDAVNAKECEIAYNATYMALLWDAVATKKTLLLNRGLRSLPTKLDGATWLNYVRCHDDIGLGFDDNDIRASGYDPQAHRRFLVDYYTGAYQGSTATGVAFGVNPKTGDARISGSLASLAGLETALLRNDAQAIDTSIRTIILLHSMIASFGGIPLIYYGDSIGTLNDNTYLDDENKHHDSRWVHRPSLDWNKAARRHEPGTVENRIFTAIQRILAVRKQIPAFADLNNREIFETSNPHLFTFLRFTSQGMHSRVLVIANFDASPQYMNLRELDSVNLFRHVEVKDLYSGETLSTKHGTLEIPPLGFYWLQL